MARNLICIYAQENNWPKVHSYTDQLWTGDTYSNRKLQTVLLQEKQSGEGRYENKSMKRILSIHVGHVQARQNGKTE